MFFDSFDILNYSQLKSLSHHSNEDAQRRVSKSIGVLMRVQGVGVQGVTAAVVVVGGGVRVEPSRQSVLCSPGRSLATDVPSICGKLISR